MIIIQVTQVYVNGRTIFSFVLLTNNIITLRESRRLIGSRISALVHVFIIIAVPGDRDDLAAAIQTELKYVGTCARVAILYDSSGMRIISQSIFRSDNTSAYIIVY